MTRGEFKKALREAVIDLENKESLGEIDVLHSDGDKLTRISYSFGNRVNIFNGLSRTVIKYNDIKEIRKEGNSILINTNSANDTWIVDIKPKGIVWNGVQKALINRYDWLKNMVYGYDDTDDFHINEGHDIANELGRAFGYDENHDMHGDVDNGAVIISFGDKVVADISSYRTYLYYHNDNGELEYKIFYTDSIENISENRVNIKDFKFNNGWA